MKQLMLGNEAIARGVYEAGVRVVSSYPGTPSTEITEYISGYPEIYSEWAPNEKVATEVAFGAAVAGGRSLTAMKHVGFNVAADPAYTIAYQGVNAGMVMVVADDPGMHSSQNEQDTRLHGRAAHIPVLDPSNSQECKDFMKLAYTISESYDTPVIVRVTTRIAHARTLVELGEREEKPLKEYVKDAAKYVSIPANMKRRHAVVVEREARMRADARDWDINRIEWGDRRIGVVTSGAAYNYVKEALPEASVLKLGLAYPVAMDLVAEFAAGVEELFVIEDMEPFFEDAIKAAGIPCSGKDRTGLLGELFTRKVQEKFAGGANYGPMETQDIPIRPPVLCPGCPHRGLYYVFAKLGLTVSGDIGCYSLGGGAPLYATDFCTCMGASIGIAHGAEKARGREFTKHTVAVLGDSTFCHSGITGLLNMAYNGSVGTLVIADNSITGMTGHQNNPMNGKDIHGDAAPQLDVEKLCEAMGIEHVVVVDPFDTPELERVLREETARDALSVVITRRPCQLIIKGKTPTYCDTEKCKKCFMCMRIGCPAIVKTEDGVWIDPTLCVGCGLCKNLCKFGALAEKGE